MYSGYSFYKREADYARNHCRAAFVRFLQDRPEGFTIDLLGNRDTKDRFVAPAYLCAVTEQPFENFDAAYDFARSTANLIGAWLDDGKTYIDVVRVFAAEESAKASGHALKQKAIYDLTNEQVINL